MTAQTSRPVLTFEIDTTGAPSTLYVTSDATANTSTLKIGSTAGEPTDVTPAGHVPDISQAGSVPGSLLYLDLSPLNLSDQEFSAIRPADSDWTFGMFPATRIIGMTPIADITLKPGTEADIVIGPLACAHATGASASLVVTAFRVAPVTVGTLPFPTSFGVSLATPPDGGDQLNQDLLIDLVTPDVVNTVTGYNAVANQLSFAMYAGARGRPVTPGPDTEFNLSFVYSSDPNGYGALCSVPEALALGVVAGTNAAGWTITPNRTRQSPSWTLRPPPGAPIVGTGSRSIVGFLVDDLVTTYQPGPTVAMFSYSGLPGYADGVFTLLITKQGHVRITSLSVAPAEAVLGNGQARVTVTWTTESAGTMTLAPFDVDVTGTTSYRATITDTTEISLTAQGTYLASLGNIALANTTARVRPVVNSFVADPTAIYAGDLPRDVALHWDVNTPGQLRLLSSVGPVDPTKYASSGTISKTVGRPQMFTLVPLDQSGGEAVQRSIVVSAFTPQVRAWPTGPARYLAAPPNAGYVLVSDGADTVVALDTMVYQPVSDGIAVGSKPAGMVFSADGSTLYVADSGSGTVSVLSVAPVAGTPRFSFTPKATVTVGGSPQQVALSPDGAYLYVTVDKETQPGQLAVVSAGPEPAVVDTLTIGLAPRGVAVLPSGAQVFAANLADGTVSVIGRAPNGTHQVLSPLTGVGSAQDVAVSNDGNVLLVTCPATNSVTAINTGYPNGPRQVLTVGGAPQHLAVLPSGAYAVVTSSGGNTVSLLSIGSSPARCRVLAPGIDAGSTTAAVAVAPDGGLVLLGGPTGLVVATLAEYQPSATLPLIGGRPTDVTVSPSGGTVLAWHNAYLSFTGTKPSTGLFRYDVSSQTVTPLLSGTRVADAVYHPDPAASLLFLIDTGHQAVQLINTGTWTGSGSIELAGQTAGSPVALAVAGDGSRLFVLATTPGGPAQVVVYGRQESPLAWSALGTVTVWSAPEQGSILTLAAAPDGSRGYLTDQGSGTLIVVARDRSGGYGVSGSPLVVGQYPGAIALTPDGSRLYVACGGVRYGSLAEIQTATMAMRSVVLPDNGQTALADLAVTPDGTRLLATDQIMTGIRIFDTASLRLEQTISWPTGVQMANGIAIAPDASRIFTANIMSGNLGVIGQVQSASGVTRAALPTAAPDDSSYRGLFIRDYVGQTPTSGNPGGISTDSPDVWPSGQQPLSDPATTLVTGYGNDSPNSIYTSQSGATNYIYVRGLNTVDGADTARVWLYYINGGGQASLILWPPNWLNDGLAQLDSGNTYIDVNSTMLNGIAYTYPPFAWSAVPVDGHYCMLAWIENDPVEPPTDPRAGIGSLGTWDQLAAFIIGHPNMGWKNTVEQPTPTGETWEQQISLTGPPTGGLFKAGLQFTNVPTDSSFAFSIVGPDSGNPRSSANVPKTPITDPNETYLTQLDWTGSASYQTDMVVTYWAGQTPMPQGANIQSTVATRTSGLVGLVADPLAATYRARVYPTGRREDGYRQEWLTAVGMVQINLTAS